MKKVFCFNNCACLVFRTNLVLVWFQCCPSYLSRKKGISGTFLSLGLRPRLQKTFPRFPFFYFGNLDNTSIRRGQICPQTWQHNYWNKILFLYSLKVNKKCNIYIKISESVYVSVQFVTYFSCSNKNSWVAVEQIKSFETKLNVKLKKCCLGLFIL